MRLPTAQGKLKIEHSIIDGVRDLLRRLLEENCAPTDGSAIVLFRR